jgi:formate dehydrogenase alpha subunit
MPTVTVNGQKLEAASGHTVLEAARQAGIVIPTLCYHPDLSVDGSCRLCLVEMESQQGQFAACTLPVSEGMVVRTETPALADSRRFVLEMLLCRYGDAGYAAGDREETEFMHWVRHYGVKIPLDLSQRLIHPVDGDPNPFVRVDLNKCILCTRCVRACAEVQGRFVWNVGYRGDESKIIAGLDTTMLEARCESCGACSAYCPTGALDDKMSVGLGKPERVVPTTCTYCGVGCGLNLNVKDGRVIRVTSNPAAPVNGMALCVKGRYGYDFIHHSDRLQRPRVRRYLLSEGRKPPEPPLSHGIDSSRWEWVDVDWDQALDIVVKKLVAIKNETGPDAIGVLASAKCTNEENYLMQKFARQVIGTHNVDHCARLCHSSTVAGLAMAYGSGAMSNSMEDVASQARAIFLIGSNVTEQHPVFGSMIRRAVLSRGLQLVVADPRKIDITEFAALHLRHRPGTDVALINGLMHIVLKNKWQDQHFIEERCDGFEEFRATVKKSTPDLISAITGVPPEKLHQAAEILARQKPMAVIWAMGITQHTTGVSNVLSLANLQMLLGNMGKPGGGVNPLRGQNNVQGACDMGALPNVFPGYQAVSDPTFPAKFDMAWALTPGLNGGHGTPSLGLSGKPGLTMPEMVEGLQTGKIRALYILGEDLAMTEPDVNHARKCLESCEFLVLQEIFHSETAAFADVLLPGASFAEKSGTFTNTERRVQLVRKAIEPVGQSRPDWAITAELARLFLAREGRIAAGPHAGWNYGDSAEIMDEIAAVTPSYAGVSYSRLERGDRLQWPVRDSSHPGTPILHVDRFTRGRGKFHPVDFLPAAELTDAEFPLLLTTGRVLYHWHGGEISRRAEGLLEAYPEALAEVHPEDAAKIGLNGGAIVRVRSRRGEMVARAVVTDRVAPGVIFANFHFPGPQNVNNVTIGALDPIAKIPEYKVCAVAIESAGHGALPS